MLPATAKTSRSRRAKIENGIPFAPLPMFFTSNSFLDIKTESILRSKKEMKKKIKYSNNTLSWP